MIPSARELGHPSVRALPQAPAPPVLAAAPEGHLVEVGGDGAASLLAAACADVQRLGEPVAWVVAADGVPHPLDLAAAGIDLDTLVLVRAAGAASARAAEMLLASGGFGLVVVEGSGRLRDRSVARLRALCRRHRARLLVAPGGERPLLGGTVTLRLAASRRGNRLGLAWAKDKAGVGAPLPELALRLPPGAARPPEPTPVLRVRVPVSREERLARATA